MRSWILFIIVMREKPGEVMRSWILFIIVLQLTVIQWLILKILHTTCFAIIELLKFNYFNLGLAILMTR